MRRRRQISADSTLAPSDSVSPAAEPRAPSRSGGVSIGERARPNLIALPGLGATSPAPVPAPAPDAARPLTTRDRLVLISRLSPPEQIDHHQNNEAEANSAAPVKVEPVPDRREVPAPASGAAPPAAAPLIAPIALAESSK